MSSFLFRAGLIGVLGLTGSTLLAGSISSPMSWSPEADWLAYTQVEQSGHDRLAPGWLFDPARDVVPPASPAPAAAGGPTIYRIWSAHRDFRQSVLIAQSSWPLSAPAWSPQGRSLAYGRFVPQSIDSGHPAAAHAGRFEVVVQDGLERLRAIWRSPELTLEEETRASFPALACAWSPDGAFLAIPRPGPRPAVVIVSTAAPHRAHTLEHATLPSWSPDGKKCAYIHCEDDYNTLAIVARDGPGWSASRQLLPIGRFSAPLFWNADGRSIYVVLEKFRNQAHEPELSQVVVETSDVVRLLPLSADLQRRMAPIRGVVVELDREADQCFFSVDLEGRDMPVVWSMLRERPLSIHKRFAPLDSSQRIGAISLSPDGRLVAVRFVSAAGLTPPAVYDTETDQTTLIVTDPSGRREWLAELAATASRLLRAGLPAPIIDGRPCLRPTLLPLPGELPALEAVGHRVSRLARQATTLFERSVSASSPADDQAAIEIHLAFAYLDGDFATAANELERLDRCLSSYQSRLALLGLRAQILWARGDASGARAVVDFLVSATAARTQHVDETPLGLVLTPNPNSGQDWARFMAAKAAQSSESPPAAAIDPLAEPPEPAFQNPFRAPDGPGGERRGGDPPFAPIFPDVWGHDLERIFAPDAPNLPRFVPAHPPAPPQPAMPAAGSRAKRHVREQ